MNTNTEPIVRVENLTVAYGDDVILKDISFEVGTGEIFVILGGSGCGKSTLLKHMIRLREPVKGRVLIDGIDVFAAEGYELRGILRRIGVMYQNGALFGSMDLLDNICLVLEEFTNLPRAAMEMIALTKLNIVGLVESAYKMPSELSGGMKKRAAIARAMALDPKILFLDEPSAGLDPVTSAQVDELILKLSQSLKMTFVIVTHELPSIFTVADRVIMLEQRIRGILAAGRPQDLRDHSDNSLVRQFFNRRAETEAPE